MMRKTAALALMLCVLLAAPARGKVDLVTLPARDSVQLTIYNSADLTLVRDRRPLTLKKGTNRLQFSWSDTLIDPTSLQLEVKKFAGEIDVVELSYPPRAQDVGVWRIESNVSGKVPVEITYFTSGLSWKSYYMATLTQDGSAMNLEGYVRVTNKSGEDYENARTRLVVGKINLLDKIAKLGQREHPYGSPAEMKPRRLQDRRDRVQKAKKQLMEAAVAGKAARKEPKEIKKEGVSEYFLYTIEGTETIKNNWSRRLPSFEAEQVAVESLYRYDPRRYDRDAALRFLRFTNDEEHNLGETPLPGGSVRVFRRRDAEGHLSYVGSEQAEYIPVGQEVELQLGAARKVKVEPKVMNYAKENIIYDDDGNVNGFDELKKYDIAVNNYGQSPATVEVVRHFPSQYWSLENLQNPGEYTKVDQDTAKYMLEMGAGAEETISYEATIKHGRRRVGQ
mgnify:CR=1 FL=1